MNRISKAYPQYDILKITKFVYTKNLTIMDYQKQANDFAKKYGVTLKVNSTEFKKHFDGDTVPRWVFNLTLKRGKKQYTFNFGQSIAEGGTEPEMYSVLACLTKCDPRTFEDFCSEYGYDTDSRSAEKIYKAVVKEYKAVERLFGDCIEDLAEVD